MKSHGYLLLVLLITATTSANDLLPQKTGISTAIDHYLTAKHKQRNIVAAPIAPDWLVLRRTMLDLTGRVPTAVEVQEYVESSDPRKREKLVDALLGSPLYVEHQAIELNAMLLAGEKGDLREYLRKAVAENRRWDQVFREMILGEKDDAEQKGAIQFVKSRAHDQDKLTNHTSSIFFGINVSCTKCHDHPLVSGWTQDHFYGMKSFFNRTFDNGGFIGEREYGLVKYQTVAGESRDAKLMFLTGAVLDEPDAAEPNDEEKKKEKKRLDELKKKKQAPPQPKFSRRGQLVDVALRPTERHFFARNIVNRMIHQYLGRGLVMPLDQMHEENPPSHPELLDWLARDTVDHGYDLQRLIRGIVLSDAYARDSSWKDKTERPADAYFAVSLIRPMTPEQYAVTLRLAVTNPDEFAGDRSLEDRQKRIESIVASGRGFASRFERPREGFQISAQEALMMSNSDDVTRSLLGNGRNSLLYKIESSEDPHEQARIALKNVFGRNPDEEMIEEITRYLDSRKDRTKEAWQQLLWALITSSECRFNY